jgi:predicted enzyme related to lactoylglutathione lyase
MAQRMRHSNERLTVRRSAIMLAVAIAVAVGWSSIDHSSATASPQSGATVTTTLPEVTAPASGAPTGKIFMVKLFVGSVKAAEKFYGEVFGASLVYKVAKNAHVLTFPGGFPGLILLKKRPGDQNKFGAFIMQVPNLDAAKALAVANGAKVQQNFSGNPGGKAAKSVDVLDPWGNQIEILQIG